MTKTINLASKLTLCALLTLSLLSLASCASIVWPDIRPIHQVYEGPPKPQTEIALITTGARQVTMGQPPPTVGDVLSGHLSIVKVDGITLEARKGEGTVAVLPGKHTIVLWELIRTKKPKELTIDAEAGKVYLILPKYDTVDGTVDWTVSIREVGAEVEFNPNKNVIQGKRPSP